MLHAAYFWQRLVKLARDLKICVVNNQSHLPGSGVLIIISTFSPVTWSWNSVDNLLTGIKLSLGGRSWSLRFFISS